MNRGLVERVRRRAGGRCEYCLLPVERESVWSEIDHVIAVVHGGRTVMSNLALACWPCNSFKGPKLAGIDRTTRRITRLFHPRVHKWGRHFVYEGPLIVGRTAIGRATINVLRINMRERVAERAALIAEGIFGPPGRE
jgi:HNH endonuclease